MPEAILYARFSPRPNAEDCDSCERQLERCRAYCRGLGYEVAGEYRDEDASGGNADRPGLLQAVAHARRVKGVLVVYKLDRFARNAKDCLALIEELVKSGADLASITETINTRGALGKFFITVLAAFDELVRNQIRERTSLAMRQHQKNGRRMGRADRLPYGTMLDPGDPDRLVDCPEELVMIETVLQLRAQGGLYRTIAGIMNRNGDKCRGGPWHESLVRKIVRRGKVKAS